MPKAKKDPRKYYGMALIEDRFSTGKTVRRPVARGSVTEYGGVSKLGEKLEIQNKQLHIDREEAEEPAVNWKYAAVLDACDYSLSIPPRVSRDLVCPEDYKEVEKLVFNRWKSVKGDGIFERNIEVWRQLWIACERAEVIAQLVDARDPLFFYNRDLQRLYPSKRHVVLCNKADLAADTVAAKLTPLKDVAVYLYSARAGAFEFPLSGNVALVGFPNVGKSSTINTILKHKKARVSATPGKTQHLQTIRTKDFMLIDCPGLVFPGHSKLDLVLHGVLNVDQVLTLGVFTDGIVDGIGEAPIAEAYGLRYAAGGVVDEPGAKTK